MALTLQLLLTLLLLIAGTLANRARGSLAVDNVESLQPCATRYHTGLERVFFTNRSITCNDGSTAGYYIRRSHGSRRWIIYLEGGWYCFDTKSCYNRLTRLRSLMTSRLWPVTKQVGGILSADPEENPFWWNAHHVFVPYCSSDSWSGASYPKSAEHMAFLGSEIVQEVVKELLTRGLLQAKKLYLVGSSAGGTGVLLNVDRVADLLSRSGAAVDVRGIADSGWFLDNEPYAPHDCVDFHTCTPVEAVKLGIKLWNGQIPDRCRAQHGPHQSWKCYFGYNIYQTMKSPLFVFQWQFDEAQMTADNVGAPVTKAQWDYIHRMGHLLRKTLANVTAVFAPSCISHTALTKRDWQNIKVNDVSLPQALRCWEEHEFPGRARQLRSHEQVRNNSSEFQMMSDMPHVPRHRQHRRFRNNQAWNSSAFSPRNDKKRKNKRKNRKRKDKKEEDNHSPSSSLPVVAAFSNERCSFRLMDECTWPQCNRACPKLHNPFTGEEMDFIELLKSFGLDMRSVATALGLDMETLQTMGNDHLLQILTQNTSK